MPTRLDLRGCNLSEVTLPRPDLGSGGPIEQVRAILDAVRRRGDAAVRKFTAEFDGVEIEDLSIPQNEWQSALDRLPSALRQGLEEASNAVKAFHEQKSAVLPPFVRGGIVVEHRILPVRRAGVYVPGGGAKYPSTVLMTAIPARVAGVESVVCCVPPNDRGNVADEVLAAAAVLAGVDELYRIGGAQAIGAMAYGTESIEHVDVIAGPGNKWVSIAQREVRGLVGVPSAFAGPSEVVVVADESTPVDWAAIDVIVQAEHGPDGLAWLVTWSETIADDVSAAIDRLVDASPRAKQTAETLASGGYVALVDGPSEAMELVNLIAPEHLEILTDDAEELVVLVRNVGAIFLGANSPASVGDYLAGPSHVLPTFATARFASVLGVEDFCRRSHTVRVERAGIERAAKNVAVIAEAEGLPAHAESVLMRIGEGRWSES